MNGFIEIADGLWYEEKTGLPWSTRRQSRGENNGELKRLNCKNWGGYYKVKVEGKMKCWHRLVWEFFNGEIPAGLQVDHINNKRDDNRIINLQLLSRKDNSRFQMKQKNNTSGFPGVAWDKSRNKWLSQIRINGKSKHLGLFETAEVAHQAYLQAKIKYHGKESIRSL